MEKPISYEAASEIGMQHGAVAVDEADVMTDQGPATWRDFVRLTKPGILFSNSIAAFGGFWIATSAFELDNKWLQLLLTLVGTVLVMASGCVLNNYLDRDMDTKMTRTQKRALPSGKIQPSVVLIYGIVLGILGVGVLYAVSPLCSLLGFIGLFVYVWLYTVWFKRTSVWGTFVGSFAGAMPPLIGYCAVSQQIDWGAILLYSILFLWQPPHFWALGIRRREEYAAAGVPLLPVVKGIHATKISMLRYIVLLGPVSISLYALNLVGVVYLMVASIMGLIWAYLAYTGFKTDDDEKWAKGMFVYSINYLTILFILMVVDSVFPF